MTPFAVSQRPSMIARSIAWPSACTVRAASPTIASSRIAGYGPASSQAWKNGPQSMYFAISARSTLRNSRRPIAIGTGGVYDAQSVAKAFARAAASEISVGPFFAACWMRIFS